jgi:hypothetical protein
VEVSFHTLVASSDHYVVETLVSKVFIINKQDIVIVIPNKKHYLSTIYGHFW